MIRLILPLVLLLAMLIGSVALQPARPRAQLTSAYTSIETLDAQVARASEDIRMAYALFQGLLTFDPHTFTVEPGVAESYEVSDDGITYTFRLRQDARWSNGDPLTARDFRFAWEVGLLPDTSPPYIEFFYYIKGAQDFNTWATEELKKVTDMPAGPEKMAAAQKRIEDAHARFDELVAVRIIDDYTIELDLVRRTAFFKEIVATWPLFPLHPPTIKANMKIDESTLMLRRNPQWTKPKTIVNNGPFILRNWEFKRGFFLEKNPHFWDADSVALNTLELINFKDPRTKFFAYENGTLDLMLEAESLKFAPDLVQAYRDGRRNDVNGFSAFATYYYIFNTRPRLPGDQPNPFTNPGVRRAFTMAIDKQSLVDNVTRVGQEPATTMVPPNSIAGYPDVTGLPYDPERARQELADAGYPGGKGLPTIYLDYNTGSGHEDRAQAIARMWQENLGIQVQPRGQEWKVFLQTRIAGNFMIARGGWFGDYTDPTTFLDLFKGGNGNNDTGFADEAYDGLLERAANEADPDKRLQLLAEAENYLLNDRSASMPLYHYRMIDMYDPDRVKGVSHHPRNLQMYHKMKVIEP
ncbi:MAG: peptide ABC transporter substrate-binding protein [Planctomycetota bacterium]|jgi:oligopeptide transport system substrate-binding protein